MKRILFTAVLLVLFSNVAFSQLQLKISTDKPVYNYGEKITITATVTNVSDTTFSIMMGSYESCQAEFYLNDYFSGLWTACLETSELLTFQPNESRIYEWVIDPKIFGLPNKDGIQKLKGTFAGGMSNPVSLVDSTEFTAPLFLGGQMNIAYLINDSSKITLIRDSLSAEVLNSSNLNGTIQETWQILGVPIDSVYNKYKNDNRFHTVELKREINYSQIVTEVTSGNIPEKFALSQNYPNPFNPATTIKYSLPANFGDSDIHRNDSRIIKLKIYDVLGREIRTLVNKKQSPGNYQVQFDASGLPSGVYIYRLEAGNFNQSKKMILLR